MTRRPGATARYLRSLYTWHRWLGIGASIFVLLLAVTGFVLNHAEDLKLDQRYVCGALLLRPYHLQHEPPQLGLMEGGHWWTLYADWLWLDSRALAHAPSGSLLARNDEGVLLRTPAGDWALHAPDGSLLERGAILGTRVHKSDAVDYEPLPSDLAATLQDAAICRQISWERWLLDLHAGRLFGVYGPQVMDAVALIFVILAGSGVVLWWRFQRSQHRRR